MREYPTAETKIAQKMGRVNHDDVYFITRQTLYYNVIEYMSKVSHVPNW